MTHVPVTKWNKRAFMLETQKSCRDWLGNDLVLNQICLTLWETIHMRELEGKAKNIKKVKTINEIFDINQGKCLLSFGVNGPSRTKIYKSRFSYFSFCGRRNQVVVNQRSSLSSFSFIYFTGQWGVQASYLSHSSIYGHKDALNWRSRTGSM